MHNIILTTDTGAIDVSKYGLCVFERIQIPTASMQYETIDVPGRDGSLNIKQGYEDIEISVTFNGINKDVHSNLRRFKTRLVGATTLSITDDPSVFYKIKAFEVGDIENTLSRYCKFTVTFRCDPFAYAKTGSMWEHHEGANSDTVDSFTIVNDGVTTQPVFVFTNTTTKIAFYNVSLKINGIVCFETTVTKGQTLTWDCERSTAYISTLDGVMVSTVPTTFANLKTGNNAVEVKSYETRYKFKTNIKYL